MLRLHHSDAPLIDQLIRTAASYPAGSRPRALVLDMLHQHRVAVAEKYKHINFKPPESVANAAKKGLDYRDKQGEDKAGMTTEEASKEGIGSGVQRASNLKNRDTISPEVIKQMVAFFSRHEKNKSIAPEHKNEPWKDKGYVSWLLWGGDPGKTWAEKVLKQMGAADEKAKKKESSMKTAAQVRDHIIRVAHKSDSKTRARLLPLARKLVALTQPLQLQPDYGSKTGGLIMGWEYRRERGEAAYYNPSGSYRVLVSPRDGRWLIQERYGARWNTTGSQRYKDAEAAIWDVERGKVASSGIPVGAKVAGMHVGNEQVRFYFNTKHVISLRTAAVINDLTSLPTEGDAVKHVAAPDEGGHVGITFGSGKSLTVHTDYYEGPQQSPIPKFANEFYAFLGDLAGDVTDEETDEILDALAGAMGASDIEPTLRSDWPEIPGGNRAARTKPDSASVLTFLRLREGDTVQVEGTKTKKPRALTVTSGPKKDNKTGYIYVGVTSGRAWGSNRRGGILQYREEGASPVTGAPVDEELTFQATLMQPPMSVLKLKKISEAQAERLVHGSAELSVGDHVELVSQQNTVGGPVPEGTTAVVTGLDGGPNNDKVMVQLDESIESQPLTRAIPIEPLNLKKVACGCGCDCGGSCSCATNKVMEFASENPDLASQVMPSISQ